MPRKPTMRQRKVAAELVANGGSVAKAMKKAGYSHAMVRNPNKMMASQGWQQLLDEYLPEEKLLQVGLEGLSAMKTENWPVGKNQYEQVDLIDYQTRHRYYETGLSLRGKLRPDAMDMNIQVIVPVQVVAAKNNQTET